MPQSCKELTTKLASLKQLKAEFDLELSNLPQTGKTEDLVLVRTAKTKLVQGFKELQKSIWPLENTELTWENIEAQYEFQKEVLIKAGLVKTLATGELGIEAIDNKEYPIPTLEQIEKMMLEKRDFFETKIPQGFVKLIMVPFGLPIGSLIEAYDQALMEHHQRGELLDTQNQPLGLNKEIGKKFIDDDGAKDYSQAEATGDLVYFLKPSSESNYLTQNNYQSKTKQELLPTQAWQVLLIENLPDLPERGQGKTFNGRKQLEACQSSYSYLEQLQIDQYKGEQGLTPESWLVYGLSHLVQSKQMIESQGGEFDFRSCFLVGGCFKKTGYISRVYFDRLNTQVGLSRIDPSNANYNDATRFAVSIF
ncbi:MAG: hypothetical protein WCW02_05020 [Candidatus Buchananbacteria bacterium]